MLNNEMVEALRFAEECLSEEKQEELARRMWEFIAEEDIRECAKAMKKDPDQKVFYDQAVQRLRNLRKPPGT